MTKKKFFTLRLPYILLGIGILLGLLRLWYFTYSPIPLGYDPGIYKEYFSHYRNVISSFDFSVLPQRIRYEPLLGILAALVNKCGVSFDRMLTRGIGIINLIPGLLLFRYFKDKEKNLRWGVFAAILYRTSIVQYQVFWSAYFKQTLGVSLMILILILREKKKVLWQSILFFLVILLHKHTALYTGGILLVSTIIERIRTKQLPWKKILYRIIAGALALLIYIPLRGRIMSEAVKAVGESSGGDFMNVRMYLKYSWPIILLSIFGAGWRIRDIILAKEKKVDVWLLGYVIGIVRIVFSLVNFNRTIVFLDLFVLIFAAYALWKLFHINSWIGKSSVGVLLVGLSIYYIVYVVQQSYPLISQEEFTSIQNIDHIVEPNALIMNTHRNYSPWIMGRSKREYINPGMAGMDLWTHQQWNQWRSVDGTGKCDMLKSTYMKLSRPLYIRMGSQQFVENISGGDCFGLLRHGSTWGLYKVSLK